MPFRPRGLPPASLVVLLLLAALVLAGAAAADDRGGKGKRGRDGPDERDDARERHGGRDRRDGHDGPERPDGRGGRDGRDAEVAADRAARASAPSVALAVGPSLLVLGGLAGGALVLLLVAVLAALRARKPRRPRAPRKSFEAGRLAAVRVRPLGSEDALAALQRARFGEIVEARWAGDDRLVVAVKRRRGRACDEIAGFLSGLFEAAWATDVGVAHPACGGRRRREPCAFEVRAASGADRRGGAASTRGS